LNCSKNIQKLQHLGSSLSNHYWDYLLVQNHVEPTLNIININGETFQRSCQVHFLHDSNCGLGSMSIHNIALILMLMKQVWNTVAKNRFARQKNEKLGNMLWFPFASQLSYCLALLGHVLGSLDRQHYILTKVNMIFSNIYDMATVWSNILVVLINGELKALPTHFLSS
jgi:hypothetical protein